MNRKSLLILFVVAVASFVSACNGGGKKTPTVTVVLSPAPPASLEENLSVQLAAQTPGDSTNAGVTWTIACTSSNCGAIAPTQTASGAATTFTAPPTVPTGGSVTITATSVADTSVSASATVTINPLGSNAGLVASGQYAFVVTGVDGNGFYAIAASVTSDGMGDITAGEEDFTDPVEHVNDAVTGTYNITANGEGTLTLLPTLSGGASDTTLGVDGTQTFSITATSNFVNAGTHLLIAEVDKSATSTGTMDLQASSDFTGGVPAASYVFALTGWDLSDDGQTSFGGVFTTATGTSISAGILDIDDTGGTGNTNPTGGTISALDANGRGVISIPGFNSDTYTYTVYMVGPEAFKMVETDTLFAEGGSMFGALAAPANGYGTAGLTGSFTFLDNGQSGDGPVGFAGQLTTDGNGNITAGFSDINEGGNLANGAVTGTYAVPDTTLPRVIFTITGGNTGDVSNVIVYLTDPSLNLLDPNNTAAESAGLLMDSDTDANGAGYVLAQAPPASSSFAGNYGAGLQVDSETDDEADLVGQGFADSSGDFTGTFDEGLVGGPTTGNAVATVTPITPDPSNPGRATFTATIANVDGGGTLSFVLYGVSSAQGLLVETDTFEVAAGTTASQ